MISEAREGDIPRRETDMSRDDDEVLLDLRDIQGNILSGFNKDFQLLVGVRFRDIHAARIWLGHVIPHISSSAEVSQFNALFRARRTRLGGAEPVGLVATWANIALSYDGLAKLTSPEEADKVPDQSFREGMPVQAESLGDQALPGGAEITAHWKVGGSGNIPDVLLVIASDDRAHLLSLAQKLRPETADPLAPQLIWEEMGETRPDLPGHEHFGFKDGISQPAIRGRVMEHGPDRYLTPRVLVTSPPGMVDFASPGSPLVWPGQFVFGYPSTDGGQKGTGGPLPPKAGLPEWLKNGSLLVFRRLRQDVVGFHTFLREEAARLAATTGFTELNARRLAAMTVGRWPSGAPVMRTPHVDIASLGANSVLANDFVYTTDTPTPTYLPGAGMPDEFPRAGADPSGMVCPRGSHLRKVNPRDQDSNRGGPFDTLMRRVLRRGIPYGPPLAIPKDGPLPVDDNVDRGLHFLCYQTSIVDQFEILQSDWANSSLNPKPRGVDMIIGQTPGVTKELEILGGNATLSTSKQFVVATGGGYFFAPSISALVRFSTPP